MVQLACTTVGLISLDTYLQWRWKMVEFRGAQAWRHDTPPCFSPPDIKMFIATRSPDDSLSLSHSESLPSDSGKLLSTSTLLSILVLFPDDFSLSGGKISSDPPIHFGSDVPECWRTVLF